MPINTIQKYVTADGKEFTEHAAATEHDIFLELRGVLQSNVPTTATNADAASFAQFARAILNNPETFGNAILRIRKRLNNLNTNKAKKAAGAK